MTHVNSQVRLKSQQTSHFGRVQIMSKVYGYRKLHSRTHQVMEVKDVILPALEFTSFGLWIDLPNALKTHVESKGWDMLGGTHAASHAVRRLVLYHAYGPSRVNKGGVITVVCPQIMSVVPMFVMCDPVADLGTECPSPYQVKYVVGSPHWACVACAVCPAAPASDVSMPLHAGLDRCDSLCLTSGKAVMGCVKWRLTPSQPC